MKIKLKTSLSGPAGTLNFGDVVDTKAAGAQLDANAAARLVERGLAEPIGRKARSKKSERQPELEVTPPEAEGRETATGPQPPETTDEQPAEGDTEK